MRKVKRRKSNKPIGVTDDQDPPTRREKALRFAELCEGLHEPARRRRVLDAFHHRFWGLSAEDWAITPSQDLVCTEEGDLVRSYGDHVCTEEDIFALSYSDASGKKYWRTWLFSGTTSVSELADVLAVHWARNEDQRAQAAKDLVAAAKCAPSTSPRDLVRWWRENPDTCRFVSPSLAAYLDGAPGIGAPAENPVDATNEIIETRPQPTNVSVSLATLDQVSVSVNPPSNGTTKRETPNRRKRGRPPEERERVKREMREAYAQGIDANAMKEKDWKVRFRASRDTCRKAMDEINKETKADKLSSNDK